MPVRITESGWRWRLAQWVLTLLYRRPVHYISPWKNAGVPASVILHNKGKILLGLRDGNIEEAGKWAIVGGFLNLEDDENLATGLVREIREETGLEISPDNFTNDKIKYVYVWNKREFIEIGNYSTVCSYFWYEMSSVEISSLQTLDETVEFKFVDAQEFEEMVTSGELPFQDCIAALRNFFKQV